MTDISNGYAPIALLANAIRRERLHAGLSVSDLARRASIAKSTLSQLESGSGNPSIETLWSLATAMGIQVTRFFEQPVQQITVIRAGEGSPVIADNAEYAATLLADCPPGVRRDMYRVIAQPGQPHRSQAHPAGTFEHVFVCQGCAYAGPVSGPTLLRTGDYMRYPANQPHVFEALESNTVAVMLIEHH